MTFKQRWIGAIVCSSFIMTMTASAGLLVSFTPTSNSGTSSASDIAYFSLFGTIAFPNGNGHMHRLFENIAVSNASVGTTLVVASDADDPDFSGAVGFYTDGIDNNILWGMGVFPGGTVGVGSQESNIFGTPGTDLIGNTITRFELTINSIDIDSPGSDPNGNGNWTDLMANYTIRIYGQPIPEPETLLFFAMGGFILFIRKRQRWNN